MRQLLHRVQRQHRIHQSVEEEDGSPLTMAGTDLSRSLYPLHAQPQHLQHLQQLQQQQPQQQLQQQQRPQQQCPPHAPHSATDHACTMYTPAPPFRDHSSPAALMYTNELLAGACLPGR